MHAWVIVDVVWAGILPSVDKKDHVILMYKSKLLLLPFSSDPESVTVIKKNVARLLNGFFKDRSWFHLLLAALPDVFTTWLARPVLCVVLVAVVSTDDVLTHLCAVALDTHAEPEVVPVLAARAHLAVTVDGVPLATHRVACPCLVKGCATAQVGGEEGFRESIAGGCLGERFGSGAGGRSGR